MAFQTVQILALMCAVALCAANSTTGSQKDAATKTSGAHPTPISMASPESSVMGLNPRPAQMNMMGGAEVAIDDIIAQAVRNTMAQGVGGSPFSTGGMVPNSAMVNSQPRPTLPSFPSLPAPMPSLPPRMPMMNSMMGMMNPLSMLSGGGGGSPFSMMRPMMMMNMFENMFEMFGF